MSDKPVLKDLDVTKIVVPEVRITSSLEPEVLEAFKASLKSVGVLEPIIVIPYGDHYFLVDGLHRLQEVRNAGLPRIKAVVVPGTEEDVYLANIATNTLRGTTKHTEIAAVISHLYKDLKVPMEKISEKTGLKLEDVDWYIRLASVDPEILEKLDQGRLKLGHVKELMRLKDRDQRLKLLTQILTYEIKVKDLKDIVDQVIAMSQGTGQSHQLPEPQQIINPATGLCGGCGREYEVKYLRGFVLCPNCYAKLVKPPSGSGSGEGGA
jgi:ParB family chromosome partitioning protein